MRSRIAAETQATQDDTEERLFLLPDSAVLRRLIAEVENAEPLPLAGYNRGYNRTYHRHNR